METIKVNFHIGTDGILKIQMPANFKDTAEDFIFWYSLIAVPGLMRYNTYEN